MSPETVTAHGPEAALTRAATELPGLGTDDQAADRGWVRTDRPREEVVDVWCLAASPESYTRFTRIYGWTDERYAAWLGSTFRDLWLGPPDHG